jgi:hypothetical protein
MSAIPITADRAATNRANSRHSTGPRTVTGKHRSSLNALRHGLTAVSPVLPTEDRAAFDERRRGFFAEYHPANSTETQLVQELIDTSWRLNRIPLLEADVLDRAANPPSEQARIDFDIVDAHRLLANLGLQGQRLSRQFQKALDTLRGIQDQRVRSERRTLEQAASILVHHQRKGIPWQPSDHGFAFSQDQVEHFAKRAVALDDSRLIAKAAASPTWLVHRTDSSFQNHLQSAVLSRHA